MKNLILNFLAFFFIQFLHAQNVGIGTTSPGSKLSIATNTLYSNIEYGIHGLLIGGEAINNQNLFFGADNTNGIGYIQIVKRGVLKTPLILNPQGGNVSVGSVTPQPSAALDISSTTQGFLPPRMSFAQRNAITSPATGLIVYQTNFTAGVYYFDGIRWLNMQNGTETSANGYAPSYVSLYAGRSLGGYLDGPIATAKFGNPSCIAISNSGEMFISEHYQNRIRKISNAGIVSTFAGSGAAGSLDAVGISATFSEPHGLAFSSTGDLYVADAGNHKIRKITPAGVVSTFAGIGTIGSVNGSGTLASFNYPQYLTFSPSGDLYVSDYGNYKIRKITSAAAVSTFAGSGTFADIDGVGILASFYYTNGLAFSSTGDLYVADNNGNYNAIRKITAAGVVSTYAGGNAGPAEGTVPSVGFTAINNLAFSSSGEMYVTDGNAIKRIKNGNVSIFAGATPALMYGDITGPGLKSLFKNVRGIAVTSSNIIYVVDYGNNSIKKIE